MALQINRNGIAHRQDNGTVVLLRPGKNGGAGTEIAVAESLADDLRLATGDIVEGEIARIEEEDESRAADASASAEFSDPSPQWDEPGARQAGGDPGRTEHAVAPSWRLLSAHRINGLSLEEAEERPSPRRRHASERAAPSRRVPLATGSSDTTGRLLDFAAPMGLGYAGIIYGPHASGLTRTLRSVVTGVCANAPDCVVIVLLLRARGEELTDWRRRFPDADLVVCPSPQEGAAPEETLRVADLTLACAQRQTELARPVVLAIDSLTGLWGAMLEAEDASDQRQADQAGARQRIQEWVRKAGDFSGEGLLGNAIGGSLTLIGTVWDQEIDPDAEEDREVHPHLRLLEHLLHETSWRVPLSGELATQRLYPAIHTARCLSQREENLLPAERFEKLLSARRALAGLTLTDCYHALMDALDATADLDALIERLTGA